MGGLAAGTLVIVAAVINLLTVECRFTMSNFVCKSSGRNELKMMFYKIAITICFYFIEVIALRILVVIVLSLFQMFLFFGMNKCDIYLNYFYSKVINIQQAILLWTDCMLIFCIIVE